jgi:hypothetical protein
MSKAYALFFSLIPSLAVNSKLHVMSYRQRRYSIQQSILNHIWVKYMLPNGAHPFMNLSEELDTLPNQWLKNHYLRCQPSHADTEQAIYDDIMRCI